MNGLSHLLDYSGFLGAAISISLGWRRNVVFDTTFLLASDSLDQLRQGSPKFDDRYRSRMSAYGLHRPSESRSAELAVRVQRRLSERSEFRRGTAKPADRVRTGLKGHSRASS